MWYITETKAGQSSTKESQSFFTPEEAKFELANRVDRFSLNKDTIVYDSDYGLYLHANQQNELGNPLKLFRKGDDKFAYDNFVWEVEHFPEPHHIMLMQDHNPENPRDFDNVGTMVCWHRNYTLGDKHDHRNAQYFLLSLAQELANENGEEFDYYWNGYEESEIKTAEEIINKYAVMLNLYLYDHSGISMNSTGFGDPWDSGQVGFIYISHKDLAEALGLKLEELDVEGRRNLFAKGKEILRNEVKVYDYYLRGETYGYALQEENGDDLDSCYGYYGYKNAKEVAKLDCLSAYGVEIDKFIYEGEQW